MRNSNTAMVMLAASVGLGACANLQTLNRESDMPGGGKAIHLDAQQRTILTRVDGTYCAEPSPDALASYAASLGLGISQPGQGAASLANALQSNAAGIGLRTQSITLMRDALYRVCEATANGVLGQVGATTMLARSQDLTAVVLAVEQLTGAVAAQQVALTSEAKANSAATLVENDKALEIAKENEKRKLEDLNSAIEKRDASEDKIGVSETDGLRGAVRVAEANATNLPNGMDQAIADTKSTNAQAALKMEEKKLEDLNDDVELKTDLHEAAEQTLAAVTVLKDAAVSNAFASARGEAQFGATPAQAKNLDAAATKEIAEAVTEMVNHVLDKNYTLDSCTAMITL